MKPNIVTPQQARQMALDQLHRAESEREACRAKEAHEEWRYAEMVEKEGGER